MSTVMIPPIAPASIAWTLQRNDAALENPLGNTLQRLVRGGPRWRATLQWRDYQAPSAGILAAFFDRFSRGDRWFYLSPRQNTVGGAWAPAELLVEGGFYHEPSDTFRIASPWTVSANMEGWINAGRAKLKNVTSAGHLFQNVTAEASKPHALVYDRHLITAANALTRIRRTSDSTELASQSDVATDRHALKYSGADTGVQVSFLAAASGTNNVFSAVSNVSFARCLEAAGAASAGAVSMDVDGGPTIRAALRAGEFFCVKTTQWELKRLVEDADFETSGASKLYFEPALRAGVADNAAVIIHKPFGRFIIPENANAQAIGPPILTGLTINAIEDVTP